MVNRSGHGGAVGVDVDDDDDAALASQKGRTKDDLKDGMVSDAQRLTSEFAAGRLTTPHFFGAMMASVVGVVTMIVRLRFGSMAADVICVGLLLDAPLVTPFKVDSSCIRDTSKVLDSYD